MRLPCVAMVVACWGAAAIWTHAPAGAQGLDRFCEDAPRPIVNVHPVFPDIAIDQGITGLVTIEFSIDRDGLPRDPVVVASSDERLNEEAIEALMKRKYRPRLCEDGKKFRDDIEFSSAGLARYRGNRGG